MPLYCVTKVNISFLSLLLCLSAVAPPVNFIPASDFRFSIRLTLSVVIKLVVFGRLFCVTSTLFAACPYELSSLAVEFVLIYIVDDLS